MEKKKLSKREALINDTRHLMKERLPMPREAMSFYNRHCRYSIGTGSVYADYITIHKRTGRLLQRIFCFSVNGFRGTNAVLEIGRRFEGGKLIL